jgi:hypothetical protein
LPVLWADVVDVVDYVDTAHFDGASTANEPTRQAPDHPDLAPPRW